MIWLILFMLLSVAFIGFVFMYTRVGSGDKKKKNKKQDDVAEETPLKTKQPPLKDLWQIEDIRDSVIFLKGGRMSAVVKLNPIDFVFLSEAEQTGVENALISTALSFSNPIQFFETTEYVDTANIVNEIVTNMPDNVKLKAYGDDMIQYLQDTTRNKNVYARCNYIILTYDSKEPREGYMELDKMVNLLKSNLIRANVSCERLNSNQIIDLLHAILNKGTLFRPSASIKDGALELYVG